MTTVYGAESDWFEIFTIVAERAFVIAVVCSGETPGLLRELRYIDERGLKDRTANFVAGNDPDHVIDDLIARLETHLNEQKINTEK